jgi:hypothetical protein
LVIGGLLVLLVVCGLVAALTWPTLSRWVRARFWRTDRETAAAIAQELIAYELPAGYAERKAMQFRYNRIVIMGPTDGAAGMSFILLSNPINVQDPEVRELMEEAWTQRIDQQRYETVRVGEREIQVGDEVVTFGVWEGEDATGQAVRQWVGVVAGNEGDVVLVVVGAEDAWDEDLAEAFITSLH